MSSNVEEMRALKNYINVNFKIFLERLEDSKQWAGQLDVAQFAEDLFYNNGFNFHGRHFSRQGKGEVIYFYLGGNKYQPSSKYLYLKTLHLLHRPE